MLGESSVQLKASPVLNFNKFKSLTVFFKKVILKRQIIFTRQTAKPFSCVLTSDEIFD